MAVAWQMYENMGFKRCPDLDFTQGELPVFGFSLALKTGVDLQKEESYGCSDCPVGQ